MTAEARNNRPGRKEGSQKPSLLEEHLDFIRKQIEPFLRRGQLAGLTKDDLVQIAAERFLRDIPDYDPALGPVTTFIYHSIRGSIIDEMRDHGSLIKIPRSVLRRIAEVNRAEWRLVQKLGREPSLDEVMEETEMTEDQLSEVHIVRLTLVRSTTPQVVETDRSQSFNYLETKKVSEEETTDRVGHELRKEAVREAIARLPDKEKEVVVSYYFKGKTLARIGNDLGVTESRACQIIASAEKKLRRSLLVLGFKDEEIL